MLRVLIVDDDEDIRHVLTMLLSKRFDVRCVTGPDEARSLVAEDVFDVIISDYSMPSGLGTALLSEVRRQWPRALRVLISGHDVPTLHRADPPWDVFFRKPFAIATLVEALIRYAAELPSGSFAAAKTLTGAK